MDAQILLFRRQYLQLFQVDFLTWPPSILLKEPGIQSWLYRQLFDANANSTLPPERYQLRVLKKLLAKIEASISNPEEDEISDTLMSHVSMLIASELPSEGVAVQQKSYVTFSCLPPASSSSIHLDDTKEPTITILERPYLISGSLTTGFRTWEASLHLGSWLLAPERLNLVKGKNVLELGAGTGFLSILCAKHLQAKHVTATDGDVGVTEALQENFFLNGLDEREQMHSSVLRWGRSLVGSWLMDDCESWPYDVVLGADITYDKPAISALVATLQMLFEIRPALQVFISGAVRNAETFAAFEHACAHRGLNMIEIDYKPKPMREQTSLFYATAVPLKIVSVTASNLRVSS